MGSLDHMRASWAASLAGLAADLDLDDPDDRAILRGRFAEFTKVTRVDYLRVVATAFGRLADPTRHDATRAIVDAWITNPNP